MIKYVVLFVFVPMMAMAIEPEVQLQMLNAKIEALEQEHAKKYAELKQCESATNNFKIAGISTLGATAVGVYANIKLHDKLAKLRNNSVGNVKGKKGDVVLSKAEKESGDNYLCAEYKADPESYPGECKDWCGEEQC